MVPWGVWGLYEAPAVEHKACPPTMAGKPPCAIEHSAVIGLGCLGAPVAVVGEVLSCQRVRDYIGKEVDVRGHLSECANNRSENYPVSAEGAHFRVESILMIPSDLRAGCREPWLYCGNLG